MGRQFTLSRALKLENERRESFRKLFTFRNVSLTFISLLCASWAALWIFRIAQNVGQPQMEYSESYMLYIARLFGTGQWSWDIAQPAGGYMVSFYTPLFYWTLGALGNVFGYSLVVGRILALICFIISLGFIYLIIQHFIKNKFYALLGVLLPLTQPFVNIWSLFVRVDVMSIMFELIGLYIVIRFWKSHWLYLSLLCFALAFYTKQSTVAGMLAVCIFILIKNWRFAIIYSGLLLLAIGLPLLIGSLLTHGQFFNEVFLYQRIEPAFRPWSDVGGYLVVAYLFMLPLLLIGLWYSIFKPITLPGIFALVALLINILIITRPGGAQNYFFEVVFAMSIVTGVALPEVIRRKSGAAVFMFLFVAWSLSFNFQTDLYPSSEYAANIKKAEAIIQDTDYPILTENADIVINAGKAPYNEPFVFSNLPKFGYWDDGLLLKDMQSGRMEYVITQYKMPSQAAVWRIDPVVQQAIVENYHIVLDAEAKSGYGFVVYETNSRR